jgi:ribose transport system substrate-binding protein
MKRYLALSTAGTAAMLLALTAACSSSSSPSSSTGGSTTGGSTAGKHYTMTFIQGVAGDGFYVTMGCGIKAEAQKLGNITVNIQGPTQFDATLQNPIIEAVTAAKPSALLIAADNVSASRPPIAAAMAAGIKVVLVDTTLSDPSGAVSQISSDNLAGGADAFAAIKELVPGGGPVLVVNTKPGISTTDQRIQGFAQEIKAKYPGITVLSTQYDNDSSATAASQVSGDISAHPNLSGVFATNVLSAEGAATGVKHAGKSGAVKVATFDADPQQMNDLKNNVIQVAIAQSPYLEGQDGVEQAVNSLTGKPVTDNVGTPLTAITQKNMNSPSIKPDIYKDAC